MTTQPVVAGFHPDPSVCRVGDEYFLVNSTFEYLPGVPVRRSRDLVHWTLVGHAYECPEQIAYPSSQGSGGIFAPCLRHRDGRFFLITTDIHQVERGQMIVHAEDPAGPWSEPVFVEGTPGIDPDLFWDQDGTCWMSWVGGFGGDTPIRQVPIDPMTGERLGEVREAWHGSGLANPEGPHVFRRGDWYYLMLAEGGTERGHAVTIARSRTLAGPWQANPANPVLSHRSTTHPVQNTGHADLVELADGSWAMVFLGVRPQGPTPGFHLLGRETFVAGIDWVDDWPVVVEGRFPVPEQGADVATDFREPLGLQWVAPGRFPSQFAGVRTGAGLVVEPPEREQDRSLVCTRVDGFTWQASARIDQGRLTLRLDDGHWAAVERREGRVAARLHVGPLDQVLAEVADDGSPLVIRASLPPAERPTVADQVELGVLRGDEVVPLAGFDGRYLSTEVAALFTGRMVGIEAPFGQQGPTTATSFAFTHGSR